MDTLTARRLLGLHAGALSARQVDTAFRTRLWSAHPDNGGDNEALRRLIEARDLLRRVAEHPERPFAGSVRRSPVEVVDLRLSRRLSRGLVLWARARVGRRPRRVI
jgi:hypothetical protein